MRAAKALDESQHADFSGDSLSLLRNYVIGKRESLESLSGLRNFLLSARQKGIRMSGLILAAA
jgi:hypothetical protein